MKMKLRLLLIVLAAGLLSGCGLLEAKTENTPLASTAANSTPAALPVTGATAQAGQTSTLGAYVPPRSDSAAARTPSPASSQLARPSASPTSAARVTASPSAPARPSPTGPALTNPAQNGPVYPVLVYPPYETSSGYLLGAAQKNQWLDPATTARLLKGGENYYVYSSKGFLGSATGTAPLAGPPTCPKMQSVTLDPPPSTQGVFAIGGSWKAQPRPLQEIPVSNETYRKAIEQLLQSQGIAQPEVKLNRIVSVDLDGDGSVEVILSASRFAEKTGHDVTRGDYSLVVIRKVSGNSVQTLPLVANYYLEAKALAFPDQYTLAAVLDLNGDGKMEIGVGITGWEKLGTLAYEIDADKVKNVLSMRCKE